MELKQLLDFSTALSGELSNMQTTFRQGDAYYKPSHFNKATNAIRNSRLQTATNLYNVFRIYAGFERNIAVVSLGKKNYGVEMTGTDGKTQVVYTKINKSGEYEFSACVIDENGNATPYSLQTYMGTAILCCLMPVILEESEAGDIWNNQIFKTLLSLSENSTDWLIGTNLEEFGRYMETLSDNINRRFSSPDNCGNYGIRANMVTNGLKQDNITLLSLAGISKVQIVDVIKGTPQYFTVPKSVTTRVGKYALTDMSLYTEEQRKMIPELPDWYVVPKAVDEICRKIKGSTRFPSPIRTFGLVGASGSGKTEMSKECASQLGLPYDHYVCHENTELLDMLFQILPTGAEGERKSFDEIRKELKLPDLDDVVNDPQYAYEQLHGHKPQKQSDVDSAVLCREIIEKTAKKVYGEYANSKDFIFVKGGLLRAIEEGKFFEIQEIANVRRQGDMVGLNALLTTGDDAFITLPTGETVTKSPNCVICFTTNRGYEGCGTINQSVLSRMALVKTIETPETEVLVERVMNRLNFPLKDKDALLRMASVVKDIEVYSRDHDITDGVCGYRELENWAMSILVETELSGEEITDELIAECGIDTVLNKVSQTDEYIEEIRIACYDKQFGN